MGITLKNGRVDTVVTARGTIRTPVVVNAAGMWADQIGRMVGVRIPIIPMQHQYLLTHHIDGAHRDLPVLRDPDLRVYCREEIGRAHVSTPVTATSPIPSSSFK